MRCSYANDGCYCAWMLVGGPNGPSELGVHTPHTTLFADTAASQGRDVRRNGSTRGGAYLVPRTVIFRDPGLLLY